MKGNSGKKAEKMSEKVLQDPLMSLGSKNNLQAYIRTKMGEISLGTNKRRLKPGAHKLSELV